MPLNSNDRLRLSEEAAQMIFDLEEHGSKECEARLAAWLANSPAHVDAYLRTTVALREFDKIDTACEAAKYRATRGAPPVPTPVAEFPRRTPPSADQNKLKIGLVAALAAAIVGALAFDYLKPRDVKPHETQSANAAMTKISIFDRPGFVELGLSSVIRLGDRTRVEVREQGAGQEKDVTLIAGEVLFFGHHDPQYPLRVFSGTASLDVLGTEFEVVRVGQQTRVTVLEGKVSLNACAQISPTSQSSRVGRDHSSTVMLTTNETAIFDDKDCSGTLRVEKVDARHPIKGAVFSTDGNTIEFQQATVGEALELLNRTNPHVLIVADDSLQSLRFGGRFPANPEEFVHLLQQIYKIHAERGPAPDGYTFIHLKVGQ